MKTFGLTIRVLFLACLLFWLPPRPGLGQNPGSNFSWKEIELTGIRFKKSFEEFRQQLPLWIPIGGGALAGGGIIYFLVTGEETPAPPPPVATDDAIVVRCRDKGSVDVLINDTGEDLRVTAVGPVPGATLILIGKGTIVISDYGNAGFRFPYTVADRQGRTATAYVEVSVELPLLQATADDFQVAEGQVLAGNVLNNDQGEELVVTGHGSTGSGTLTIAAGGALSFVNAPGQCAPVNVTYTVGDRCWQEATVEVNIDILDETAPVITCPVATTIACGQEPDPVLTGEPGFTDNCDSDPDIAYTDEISGTSCEQLITRTWRVTDATGNGSTCVQLIRIEDLTAPVITCPADQFLICGQPTGPVQTGMPIANDACAGTEVIVSFSDAIVGSECNQVITRTWTVADPCGNISLCTQTIAIQPTEPRPLWTSEEYVVVPDREFPLLSWRQPALPLIPLMDNPAWVRALNEAAEAAGVEHPDPGPPSVADLSLAPMISPGIIFSGPAESVVLISLGTYHGRQWWTLPNDELYYSSDLTIWSGTLEWRQYLGTPGPLRFFGGFALEGYILEHDDLLMHLMGTPRPLDLSLRERGAMVNLHGGVEVRLSRLGSLSVQSRAPFAQRGWQSTGLLLECRINLRP